MPSIKIKKIDFVQGKNKFFILLRLHGSYENLIAGYTADALIDMSGIG